MRGKASVPVRIGRMEEQQANRTSEHQIAILAEEFGLDPNEVRHELEEIERRIRHYGPESVEVGLHRLAAEFDLDPEEIRAEVEETSARLRARGVVL